MCAMGPAPPPPPPTHPATKMCISAKISIFLRLQQFLNIVNATAQINEDCIADGARKVSRAVSLKGFALRYGRVRQKTIKFYPHVHVTKHITRRTHVTEWRNTLIAETEDHEINHEKPKSGQTVSRPPNR